jgi:hypothetical protein
LKTLLRQGRPADASAMAGNPLLVSAGDTMHDPENGETR